MAPGFLLCKPHGVGIFVSGVLCLVLLGCNFSFGVESDIYCLKSIKDSLEDPAGYLTSSWDFSNYTEGFICRFLGIECWHPDENKVLNIKLSDLGLRGQFPRGLANCTSLTGIDLSSNMLIGDLPTDINMIIPFVTLLDLSSNSFSGEIPSSLANCSYLNVLKLQNNQFSGKIPPQLGDLRRLRTWNVSNNQLYGQVPEFSNYQFGSDSYQENSGLCGGPLKPCPK